MKVRTVILNFIFDEPVPARADKLRGFFANRFGEYTLVHHHLAGNYLLYRCPLIQYKVITGKPFVLGIDDGAELLRKIYEEVDYLKIGNAQFRITQKRLILTDDNFGITPRPIPYTFLTPWLALNEENYQRYQRFGSWEKRRELLVKVLVGNILAVAKGIGYTVPAPIAVEIRRLRPTRAKLKGVPMLGFLGEFTVNFAIPDYWGLGKSVARGFGTIARLE